MEACCHPRPKSTYLSVANQPYQTTYKREFITRRPPSTIEDAPFGQRFLIGSPYQLNDPLDSSSYRMDFSDPTTMHRQVSPHPRTIKINQNRGNQRTENPDPSSSKEMKQALRNQLNSTYQTDFIGKWMAHSPFPLSLSLHMNSANPQELLKDFHSYWPMIVLD